MGFLEILGAAFIVSVPALVISDAVDERRTLDE